MIAVNEAVEVVLRETVPLDSESVALVSSPGRILAEDIIADMDLPPFDRSQMDGFALRAADVQETPAKLRIVGESIAGCGWHHQLNPGEAVRIMTGAPVPSGADSVQQVELTKEATANGTVEILEPTRPGKSIVKRGAEVTRGTVVLHNGARINAATIAVLASFGYAQLRVGKCPRVQVLATGSELVAVDRQPDRDQIRDSNNYSIKAYAELAGAEVRLLPLAGDELSLLKDQLCHAAEKSDMVITSGGVSMGTYDFTKVALRELGATLFFEKVALRPGKPTVFARMPNGTIVFGLPGNPVSVAVTFNLFARPALLRMQGAEETVLTEDSALLSQALNGARDRESYLPARLSSNDVGQLIAEPLKWGGSSDFISFARATALIIVPANATTIEAGERVKVMRLPQVF